MFPSPSFAATKKMVSVNHQFMPTIIIISIHPVMYRCPCKIRGKTINNRPWDIQKLASSSGSYTFLYLYIHGLWTDRAQRKVRATSLPHQNRKISSSCSERAVCFGTYNKDMMDGKECARKLHGKGVYDLSTLCYYVYLNNWFLNLYNYVNIVIITFKSNYHKIAS